MYSAPSGPVNVRFRNQSGRSGADQDLIDFDPRCLDDSLPLLGICFQNLREFVRGGAFDGVGVTCELLDKSRIYESFGKVANEAGQLVIAYIVYRCWVSEFQALPDLDG